MKNGVMVAVFCLFISIRATAAVPAFVTYSGRLTDGTGWGESTSQTLVFNLYDAVEAEDPFWHTTHEDVPVIDGYFTVNLGMCPQDGGPCVTNPAEATFPADLPDRMWVGVEVGGMELGREPVGSVPYAVRAGTVFKPKLAPGETHNLGWFRTGDGVVMIQGADGAALSPENPGWISVPRDPQK